MISCAFEDGNQNSLRHAVVDTIVLRGGKILLVKRVGKLLEGNKWALVGGFVERNETTKEAAAREVMEETGWEVTNLELLKVNDDPNRPKEDRQNISFIYFCNATKKTGEADEESDEQRWFAFSELPPENRIAFDHGAAIKLYQEYLKKPFAVPVTS